LGDKWSLLIVRDMVFRRKRYFKEFLSSDEAISTNILTDRLNRLELIGVISKQPDPENGRQIVYGLTEKGIALIPLLVELVCWGAIYDGAPDADPDAVRRIQRDKPRFIRKLARGCRP
jgi:DNA-binding HxlR family transcriptional regulator